MRFAKFNALLPLLFVRIARSFLCCLKKAQVARRIAAFFVCFCLLSPSLPAAESSLIVQEDKLKAVYVFNFIRFTEWPLDPKALPVKQTNLAIFGNNDLLNILHGKSFRKTSLGAHLNTFSCSTPASCISHAQALFIDRSERGNLEEILSLLSNKPVLTISDIPAFAEKGGMIELQRHNGAIRFRINLQAIKRANLYVSSQLLQMAEMVGNKP
jgi:hypothetical protein